MGSSPSQDAQHKVTRSITTPPEWNGSPLQGTQQVTKSITIAIPLDLPDMREVSHPSAYVVRSTPGSDKPAAVVTKLAV